MIPVGIANSSPLIGLERIGRLGILEKLFERLLIPEAVLREVGKIPPQASVEPLAEPPLLSAFPPRIHVGEASVILLGLQNPGAVLILDDWYAREFAAARKISVVGTVGLLLRAKESGIIPTVREPLDELKTVGFRISPAVVQEALRLAKERC